MIYVKTTGNDTTGDGSYALPFRTIQKAIETDIQFIIKKLDNFNDIADTINEVNNFVEECKPKLQIIKTKMGSDNELYLKLSSTVVNSSLNLIIELMNNAQDKIYNSLDYERNSLIYKFKNLIKDAIEIIYLILPINVYTELKNRLEDNKKSIWKIAEELNISTLSKQYEKLKQIREKAERAISESEKQRQTNINISTFNKECEKAERARRESERQRQTNNYYSNTTSNSNKTETQDTEGLAIEEWIVYFLLPFLPIIWIFAYNFNGDTKKKEQCIGITVVHGFIILIVILIALANK